MLNIIMLVCRALQLLLTLSILGLTAYVADWYRMVGLASPPPVNFLIAAPVLALLSLIHLEAVSRFFPRASHPYAALSIEAVNTVFFFAGFIALAVFLARLSFCSGAVCSSAQAAVVLAAANFVLWVATAAMTAKDVFKGGLRAHRSPPPVQPPMRQQETA